MVTLNHLDAMQDYTCNTETRKSIRLAHEFLINVRNAFICSLNCSSLPQGCLRLHATFQTF